MIALRFKKNEGVDCTRQPLLSMSLRHLKIPLTCVALKTMKLMIIIVICRMLNRIVSCKTFKQ